MEKQTFAKVLNILKGTKIGMYLPNNHYVSGELMDVKDDHLIVDVEDNIFYIVIDQIHVLSKNSKDLRVTTKNIPYLDRIHLAEVLNALKHNWITVNSLNNQTFTGLLSRISIDYIMLINGEDQLYIQKSFISNLYKGKYEKKEQSNDSSDGNNLNPPSNQDSESEEITDCIQEVIMENQQVDKESRLREEDKLDPIYIQDSKSEEIAGVIQEEKVGKQEETESQLPEEDKLDSIIDQVRDFEVKTDITKVVKRENLKGKETSQIHSVNKVDLETDTENPDLMRQDYKEADEKKYKFFTETEETKNFNQLQDNSNHMKRKKTDKKPIMSLQDRKMNEEINVSQESKENQSEDLKYILENNSKVNSETIIVNNQKHDNQDKNTEPEMEQFKMRTNPNKKNGLSLLKYRKPIRRKNRENSYEGQDNTISNLQSSKYKPVRNFNQRNPIICRKDNKKLEGIKLSNEQKSEVLMVKMSPREEKEMIRMQYYALMKHAEKMYIKLSE